MRSVDASGIRPEVTLERHAIETVLRAHHERIVDARERESAGAMPAPTRSATRPVVHQSWIDTLPEPRPQA